MQGHAGANLVPVIAANRIGVERGDKGSLAFYGSSFITDHTGLKLAEADRVSETVITATLDLEAARQFRRAWGPFRDRRPELYGAIAEQTPGFLRP
jgi:N-carbamoylputrescine amidase